MKKSKIYLGIAVVLIIMTIGVINFIDFPRGYYCDVIDYNVLADAGCVEYVELPEKGYGIEFKPSKDYLSGFQIHITGMEGGELQLSVYEVESAILVDDIIVNSEQFDENEWYKVYLGKVLEKDKLYKLHITANKCESRPHLEIVDSTYLSEENMSGNMLIGYAYKKPMFTAQEKALISVFIMAIGTLVCCNMFVNPNVKKRVEGAAVFALLVSVLTQNYMYNSIDNKNQAFQKFQTDSEMLVMDVIWAEENGIWFQEESIGYGLGKYNDETGILRPYKSQYGLQGKVSRHLARYMEYEDVLPNLEFGCGLATAMVLVILVWLLNKKYNTILAGCFYVTFWLSPWIVNFARNLYWVEFTWFLPMVVGLFCAWKVEDKKCRILSYILAFGVITIKCLCGYEYISCIMLGLIAFLLVDFVLAITGKDKKKKRMLLKAIFVMGAVAIAGFSVALCIHARIRGAGDITVGLRQIYEADVVKRTYGGNFNEFSTALHDSFNASTWEVLCMYFHFPTEIITGVGGNLFAILAMTPLVIFFVEWKNRKMDVEMISMYVVFFVTTISWHILAKSHSYIHTHMSYVLWYFGFVQICFYIIVDRLIQQLHMRKG